MRLLSIFTLLLITNALSAQVQSAMTTYDDQTFPSLRLTLDAPAEEVGEQWEDFLDDRYDVDIDRLDKDRNSMAYRAEQVVLPLVGQKNLDIYTKVTDVDNRTDVALALAYTAEDVVTKQAYPDAYSAAEAILNEFRTAFYTKYFDDQLADARDDLEDMRDDSQDDSKDAEKARRKIAKYRDKIDKYEERIIDLREEVGDELESSEDKALRAAELENRVREIERRRATYLR